MQLRPIDLKILKELQRDARQSYREIARRLKVSVATVLAHTQELEKEGIIKGYHASIDYERLGYDVQIILDVRISKGKLSLVEKRLAKHPNIFAVYDNTGHFDATIIAKFKTRRQMDKFLKEIQSFDFIERTETKLVLSILKEGLIDF